MKSICTLFVVTALTVTAPAQTLIQRFDLSRGSAPYLTTAWLDKSGWEVWAFGDSRSDTLDLEFGRLLVNKGKWSLSGYAVNWPQSGKWFVIPWTTYSDTVAKGALTFNLATYVPLNGGPNIWFSDGSSLMWPLTSGTKLGISGAFSQSPGSNQLRFGPQIELPLGTATLRVSYHPFVMGDARATMRVEITQKF